MWESSSPERIKVYLMDTKLHLIRPGSLHWARGLHLDMGILNDASTKSSIKVSKRNSKGNIKAPCFSLSPLGESDSLFLYAVWDWITFAPVLWAENWTNRLSLSLKPSHIWLVIAESLKLWYLKGDSIVVEREKAEICVELDSVYKASLIPPTKGLNPLENENGCWWCIQIECRIA